jgi:hypothetical protein
MLKFRCETSIGYESRNVPKLSRVAFLGVIRALQSNIIKHVLFPPSLQHPTYNWSWPDRYTMHTVQYHILSGTISFRLQGYYISAISQARLNGVLGQTSRNESLWGHPISLIDVCKKGNSFEFIVLFSTLLHLPPLRFHCIGRCWYQTQDSFNVSIGCQTLQPLG